VAFKRNESLHDATNSLQQLQRAAQPARPVLVANALEKRPKCPVDFVLLLTGLVVMAGGHYSLRMHMSSSVVSEGDSVSVTCEIHNRLNTSPTFVFVKTVTTGSTPVRRSSSLRRSQPAQHQSDVRVR